jgi:glucose/mannose-6-phosphate isomerase
MTDLDDAAVAAVDSTGQLAEIRDLPIHLQDALWRVESAGLAPKASAGLAIAGMGGSGVGAALATAAIGARATRPIIAVRDYGLPAWVGEDWTVLLSSYSGNTEETLACWDAATAAGARRIVVSTGGELVDRARADKVPVIPVPGGFQPRAAVAYATVVALEVAAIAGVAPSLRAEVDAAAELLQCEDFAAEAKALAEALKDTIPVVCGAGLTTAAAYRWKCQVNENANRAAFWSELPELDHNEIEGWRDRAVLAPVFLEDAQAPERIARRFALTADIIGGAQRVGTRGETAVERLMSLVYLGDLMSLYLAVLHGTDPVDIPALVRLKAEL